MAADETILRNGVIPMPPATRTAGLETSLCRTKEPIGPRMLTSVPGGRADRARLKGESRIRVATKMSEAKQELAIERVCVKPSSPEPGTRRRAKSINCPGPEQKVTRPLKLECQGIL